MVISKNVIREIKDRLDIVDLIKEYIPGLKKSGKNWIGVCPFHNDHNPSMHVSSELGIFKCFSCGEGGDIIAFLQKIENYSFSETVKVLAKRAGIELNIGNFDDSEVFQKKDEIIQFNNRVINLFQYFLLERKEGRKALNYLNSRGIDKELISVFKIGYAPGDFNRLLNIFNKKGFKEEFLIKAGMFKKTERGLQPLFIDRVMFPIINHKQECVGFGGRTLSNQYMPKYLNTPETILYKKSNNLYGINTAKPFLRDEKKVYIVEGYMDVISCYKAGLKNVVAPCGTAITRGQISILDRFADEVVFFLDGDNAGKKGVERAIKEAFFSRMNKSVLLLPDDSDPDDYFKLNSLEDFKQFEQEKLDWFDFLVNYKTENINKKDYKTLVTALDSLFEFINKEENEVIRNSLVERLAEKLNINKGIIAREFLTFKNKITSKKANTIEEKHSSEEDKNELNNDLKKELDLLLFLLKLDNYSQVIKQCVLREEHFNYKLTQDLFKFLFLENNFDNKKNFIDVIDDNKVKMYIEKRVFSQEFKLPEKTIFNNCIDRISDIIKSYYLRKMDKINYDLKLRVLYQDNENIKNLQEEKVLVINEIYKLSKLQELKK